MLVWFFVATNQKFAIDDQNQPEKKEKKDSLSLTPQWKWITSWQWADLSRKEAILPLDSPFPPWEYAGKISKDKTTGLLRNLQYFTCNTRKHFSSFEENDALVSFYKARLFPTRDFHSFSFCKAKSCKKETLSSIFPLDSRVPRLWKTTVRLEKMSRESVRQKSCWCYKSFSKLKSASPTSK